VQGVEALGGKFVNELFGLGGNSTVYRPPREQRTEQRDDGPSEHDYE
jgi:hypothetical protein